jgi:hypothetical protein
MRRDETEEILTFKVSSTVIDSRDKKVKAWTNAKKEIPGKVNLVNATWQMQDGNTISKLRLFLQSKN